MKDTNQVYLKGTISRTPDTKHIGSEKTVCNFSLLTIERRNSQEFKSYHRIVAWNQTADKVRNLAEGDRVVIEGKLQTRSYDKDGSKVWITEVNAWDVEALASSYPSHEGQEEYNPNPTISDDDIPF